MSRSSWNLGQDRSASATRMDLAVERSRRAYNLRAHLILALCKARKASGLSQRELAERMPWNVSDGAHTRSIDDIVEMVEELERGGLDPSLVFVCCYVAALEPTGQEMIWEFLLGYETTPQHLRSVATVERPDINIPWLPLEAPSREQAMQDDRIRRVYVAAGLKGVVIAALALARQASGLTLDQLAARVTEGATKNQGQAKVMGILSIEWVKADPQMALVAHYWAALKPAGLDVLRGMLLPR